MFEDISVFLFPDDNFSKCQWIFTKFGLNIDIVKIWFGNFRRQFRNPDHIYRLATELNKTKIIYIYIYISKPSIYFRDSHRRKVHS